MSTWSLIRSLFAVLTLFLVHCQTPPTAGHPDAMHPMDASLPPDGALPPPASGQVILNVTYKDGSTERFELKNDANRKLRCPATITKTGIDVAVLTSAMARCSAYPCFELYLRRFNDLGESLPSLPGTYTFSLSSLSTPCATNYMYMWSDNLGTPRKGDDFAALAALQLTTERLYGHCVNNYEPRYPASFGHTRFCCDSPPALEGADEGSLTIVNNQVQKLTWSARFTNSAVITKMKAEVTCPTP